MYYNNYYNVALITAVQQHQVWDQQKRNALQQHGITTL